MRLKSCQSGFVGFMLRPFWVKESRCASTDNAHPFDCANRQKERGLTLIEIILVIALLGTLMTVLITNLTDQQDEAMKDTATFAMQKLSGKLQQFRIHNFRYPTTEQGLNALLTNPGSSKWRGPYAEAKEIEDPWGNTYGYESDGKNYKIISPGPDGQLGNEDDISHPPAGGGETEQTGS